MSAAFRSVFRRAAPAARFETRDGSRRLRLSRGLSGSRRRRRRRGKRFSHQQNIFIVDERRRAFLAEPGPDVPRERRV
jgi:hypothetical protein